jgi:hypothetical protein
MSNGNGSGGKTGQANLVAQMAPVATWLVFIYAGIGGALVIISALGGEDITQELRLSFKAYLEQMVVAIGGLSIGRGILANAKTP